ncbi:hypothetical protein KC356_g1941 [Hortaea werneckii]|nr:hypothetical protein KC356_g1941 [Hortaea werneckii]
MDPIKWNNHRQRWGDIENKSDFTAFPESTSEFAPPKDTSPKREASTSHPRRAPLRTGRPAPRRSTRSQLQRRNASASINHRTDASGNLIDDEEHIQEARLSKSSEIRDSCASEQDQALDSDNEVRSQERLQHHGHDDVGMDSLPEMPTADAADVEEAGHHAMLSVDRQANIHRWLQGLCSSPNALSENEGSAAEDEAGQALRSGLSALVNLPYCYALASQTNGVPEEVLRAQDHDESSEGLELGETTDPAFDRNVVVEDEDEIEEPWAQTPQPVQQVQQPSKSSAIKTPGCEKEAPRTSPPSSVSRIPETSIAGASSPVRPASIRPSMIRHQSPSLSNTIKVRNDLERTYREEGLYALVSRVLRAETDAYSTWDGVPTSMIVRFGYAIAVTTHPEVISACIRGNWTRNQKTNKALASVLRKLKQRALSMKHPFIYLNEVADAKGYSPSPKELKKAIEIARAYYDGTDSVMAKRIDNFTKPFRTPAQERDPTFRKYIMSSRRPAVSTKRATTGRAFCRHLEDRLNVCNSKTDPLDIALAEVGYTQDADVRLKNHQRHTSSNHIMNLFDAILNILYPQKYLLHQYVIYSCCAANEVALAESFFSRCTDCYIGTGGGFSYYAAGISVRSAYIYDTQHWESSIQWALNNMCVDRNHRQQIAQCREILESLRQSKEQGEQDFEELAATRSARSDDEVLQLDTLNGDEVAGAKPGAFPIEYGEVLRSLSHFRWMQVLAQVEARNTEVRRR